MLLQGACVWAVWRTNVPYVQSTSFIACTWPLPLITAPHQGPDYARFGWEPLRELLQNCYWDSCGLVFIYLHLDWLVLVHDIRNFPGETWNWPPFTEGKDRSKKVMGHFILVGGGRFNKQGSLCTKLVLSGHRWSDLHTCLPEA